MGKFIIRRTAKGYKFDLKAANGQTIATSELYKTELSCLKGIDSMRRCAGSPVEDQTLMDSQKICHPKYEVYMDKKGEFRFRLKARNGAIIAVSEGYQKKAFCLKGIASVKKNAAECKVIPLNKKSPKSISKVEKGRAISQKSTNEKKSEKNVE